jgi:glutathione S-transferase
MAGAGRFRLYGTTGSGNCEKVRIVADLLGCSYDWIETKLGEAGTKSAAFLRDVNPAGQVPAAVFDDGRRLSESGALMLFLAEGSDLIPRDAFDRARMLEWMFWEQYSHEPAIAVRRAALKFRGRTEAELDPALKTRGDRALDRMETELEGRLWFVGDAPSLADIALYPYTRDAHEGGFDLPSRSNVTAWIERAGRALAAHAA